MEILTDLFIKSAKIIGKETLLGNPQFPEIIKSLISLYDSNKNSHGKFCKKIVDCLTEVMDKENFEAKIEKCGKKEKDRISNIGKINLEENKKMRGTISSIHFRQNLKERRKSYKLSKCNNTSFDKGNKSVTIKYNPKNKDGIAANKKNNVPNLRHNDENVQINN